jgi:hypothetical protein
MQDTQLIEEARKIIQHMDQQTEARLQPEE